MPSQLFNTYTSNVATASYANTYSKIQSLTEDPFNSLVFDRNRHSIWAQGEEYGYTGFKNLTVNSSYLTAPTFNNSNYINNNAGYARRFIDGVKYEKDNDSITVSYTYAYESSLSQTNANTGDFLRGISVSGHQITYSYNSFKTTGHSQTTEQNYVMTYGYINSAGEFHYDYRDISGSQSGEYFIYGYSQTKDGKISINTRSFTNDSHTKTTEQNYVVTYTYIDTVGKVHYDYRDISGSSAFNTTSQHFLTGWSQTKDGKMSFTKGTFSTNKAASATTHTAYVVGVSVDSSGKISYNYANVNHTYTGTNGGNTAGSHVINNINITTAGHLSYTYRDISGSSAFNATNQHFLTGWSQTADGKMSFTKGTFSISGASNTSNLPSITGITISSAGAISYTYRDISGNASSTYFTYAYTQDTTGKITSWQSGTITVPTLTGGTAGKEYVKDVTWSNDTHTLAFTKGYLDGTGGGGGATGGGETNLTKHSTPETNDDTSERHFTTYISLSGDKNHTIQLHRYQYPAVICNDGTVAKVIASGSTLRFYSTV